MEEVDGTGREILSEGVVVGGSEEAAGVRRGVGGRSLAKVWREDGSRRGFQGALGEVEDEVDWSS